MRAAIFGFWVVAREQEREQSVVAAVPEVSLGRARHVAVRHRDLPDRVADEDVTPVDEIGDAPARGVGEHVHAADVAVQERAAGARLQRRPHVDVHRSEPVDHVVGERVVCFEIPEAPLEFGVYVVAQCRALAAEFARGGEVVAVRVAEAVELDLVQRA